MASPVSTLSVALTHAIAYLTRPLIVSYPAATVIKLQLVLEANLTAIFAPTWVPEEPLRGSGRRCLTLSPLCLPPRAIYSACLTTGVQWFDWIAALGGCEFDFFIDPGYVSVRFGQGSQLVTIWSEELADAISPVLPCDTKSQSKTIAQQLLESESADDDEIFAMIADEVSAPAWAMPVIDHFSPPARSESPLSAVSSDSRSSSRSSNSSSCFSYASTARTDPPSASNRTSSSKLSRREKARQARVFVDTSKTEVTPYDGGKTTVLTGGVMLGAAPSKAKSTVSSWRRA